MNFPDSAEDSANLPEETLDHTPLMFGKFKGKTADWVATHGVKGNEYLVWAFETVDGFDVCSFALYRDCGGEGSRAARAKPTSVFKARARKDLRFYADPETGELPIPTGKPKWEPKSRPQTPAILKPPPRPAAGFDDMDDDIPF